MYRVEKDRQEMPKHGIRCEQPSELAAFAESTMAEKTISGRETPSQETLVSSSPVPQDINEPPNGGLTAWLQVVGSFFLLFNCWGIINTYGVFQTYYTNELLHTESASNIAWIGSIQAFCLLLVGVITGPLYDAGHFRALVSGGAFFVVFGLMMTSLSTTYYQILLAQGLCVGLGCGCLFIPSVAVISTYFTTRRSLATGIATTGSSIGGIILPVTFDQLQPMIGFPWATRVLGFLCLAGFAVALATMKTRLPPAPRRAFIDQTAFHEPAFILFTLGLFFGFWGLYIPFYYVPDYALYVAPSTISPAFSIYLIAIINGSSTFGRVIPNFIADKTGPLSVMAPCALISGLFAFAWIGFTSRAAIIAFCVIYGFSSGSFVSLPPTSIVSLSPNLNVMGVRMGMCFFLASFALLTGNPIAGAILGPDKNRYLGLQVFCATCVVVCALLMFAARGVKSEWKLMVKT